MSCGMLGGEEAPQSRAYGLQDAVPPCVGDAVPAKNPRPWICRDAASHAVSPSYRWKRCLSYSGAVLLENRAIRLLDGGAYERYSGFCQKRDYLPDEMLRSTKGFGSAESVEC